MSKSKRFAAPRTSALRRRRALKIARARGAELASGKILGISKHGPLISIQILSLEVVLQRLHLQHRRQDQDADL